MRQASDGQIAVADRQALGDFEIERRRFDVRLGEDFLDDARQLFFIELPWREIDRESKMGLDRLPQTQLPARCPEDPLSNRHDRADVLSERNEMFRLEDAASWPPPSQERFEGRDAIAG